MREMDEKAECEMREMQRRKTGPGVFVCLPIGVIYSFSLKS